MEKPVFPLEATPPPRGRLGGFFSGFDSNLALGGSRGLLRPPTVQTLALNYVSAQPLSVAAFDASRTSDNFGENDRLSPRLIITMMTEKKKKKKPSNRVDLNKGVF